MSEKVYSVSLDCYQDNKINEFPLLYFSNHVRLFSLVLVRFARYRLAFRISVFLNYSVSIDIVFTATTEAISLMSIAPAQPVSLGNSCFSSY